MFTEKTHKEDMPVHLLKKIMQARKMFKDKGIKKSGYNQFQKFSYYELKDIIPEAIEICLELNIATQFTYEYNRYVLRVYDLDNLEEIEFSMPGKELPNEGNVNNQLQNIGKVQTYTRRYLYMQFLDITENDVVDASKPKKSYKYPIS
ncbi:ERF family protein [Methanosphaera sp. WGK6]|uniref:ERF family protein n=1 Tax=Methanosphaera sp. WGK6 TaxID=1561964 RepID=UPI00084CDE6C|nr:ERF family protein [Methanosphaera sp. WGK6]